MTAQSAVIVSGPALCFYESLRPLRLTQHTVTLENGLFTRGHLPNASALEAACRVLNA